MFAHNFEVGLSYMMQVWLIDIFQTKRNFTIWFKIFICIMRRFTNVIFKRNRSFIAEIIAVI
ncbi:hypothetical protein CQ059_03730 [Brucella pseudogrignonensis]|nr:hypothetical protein CQ059_03730 [Brucella pseudogrignonensis]PRA42821.1 hypothetical protein CQ063_00215 [Brucella pseudogrignonensis]PRA72712.1 hypothetical protein CQ055_05370 [Brucella pseudogrignonensis]